MQTPLQNATVMARALAACACAATLSGCLAIRTYEGPTPLSPTLPIWKPPARYVGMDSTSPTFSWKATRPGARYELAVWQAGEGVYNFVCPKRPFDVKPLYRVQGIEGTTHTVTFPLMPDQLYYWSVREEGKEWMSVNYHCVHIGGWANYNNWPFLIRVRDGNATR